HVLPLDAHEPLTGIDHVAVLDELIHHKLHAVGGDCEAYAVRSAPAVRVHRAKRWQADQLAAQVDQRAAAVAGIDRRAGLDQPGELLRRTLWAFAGRAVERADDAKRR